ncbi:MAG: cupin domain-containing protein [Myxococcales bacterium]|nr:MAG: cupin domain-containing protein [Myxococcales bacterium]
MPTFPLSLDDELSALLTDEPSSDPPAAPVPPARVGERLMASVGWLERFTPLAPVAAEALGTDVREARQALHLLSDATGWMEIPLLPGVRIRPVTGRGGRELPGALFAEVQPGGGLPRHAHRGEGDEVMLVLQGALREVERPDLVVGPGGSLRSSEDSEHTLEATGDEVCFCLVVHGGWADYL